MLRDYAFERETAADLTAFMIEASPQDAAVFHLHGRATRAGSLVITERDYLKLYLTQDDYRDTVDEGINIAFSGSPVLFLGLGMEETDLLRPLRQFISNRDRTIGYASIALLPADGPLEARTKFSSALYLRYGVYTIFYGSGYIEIDEVKCGKIVRKKRGIDWLHRILSLIRSLSKELNKWDGSKPPQKRHAKDIATDLYKALGEIGADLADIETDYPASTSALAVLYGGTEPFDDDADAEVPAGLLDRMLEEACRLRCCIFSPIRPRRGLWQTHHYDEDTFIKGDIYLRFFIELLDQIVKAILTFPDEFRRKRTKQQRKETTAPFRIALDGLQGAFVTGALNAALDGIAKEQNSWWKKWQESPPHRKAAFQCLEVKSGNAPRNYTWDKTARQRAHVPGAVFVRHQVDNVITPKLKDHFKAPGYKRTVSEDDTQGNWRIKRDYATRIRAFDTFITAAEATFRDHPTEKDTGRRRIITIAAHRGLGKGTFMSAFSTERGRALYRNAVWPRKPNGAVEFVAQVFVNLGFSPEIASVYDSLCNALADSIGYLRQKWLYAEAKKVWLDLRQRPTDDVPEKVQRELEDKEWQLDLTLIKWALDRKAPFEGSPFEKILSDPTADPDRAGLSRNAFELSWAIAANRLLREEKCVEILKRLFIKTRLAGLEVDERRTGEDLINGMTETEIRTHFLDQLQVMHREALKEKCDGLSRLDQLELLFHRFRDRSRALADRGAKAPTPRFLLNVYAIELLFDRSRRAKNGEIHRLLDLFFGSQTEDCPIDFVFVGDEQGLGTPWDNPSGDDPKSEATDKSRVEQYRLRMDRKKLPPGAEGQIKHRLSVGHIRLDQRDQKPPNAPALPHFVHFARPVNPVSLLVDNFRTLAMAFYLVNPPPAQEPSADEKLTKSRKSFARAVRSAREASDEVMTYLWTRKELPTKEELRKARYLGRGLEHDRFKPEPVGAEGPSRDLRKKLKTAQRRFVIVKERVKRHAAVSAIGAMDGDLDVILLERLRRTNPQDGSEWHRVRHNMGESRIALTLLLAACEHIVIHAPDAYEGGIEAQDFIRNTVEAVRNVGNDRRDQMALEAVLNRYQRYHKIADADLDADLHAMILRHLGVIGTPISSAVLVRLPEFRNYFQRIGIELEMSRRRFLVHALTTLSYRGLVFRLDPHPRMMVLGQDHDDWDDDKEYRYALHRIIQSYALSKLDPNALDPLKRNNFAPTLYSSQVPSGTQLTRDSYRFLRSLMIGLSQYPDVPQNELGIEPWLFTTRSHAVRAQAVRAALTLARSTYSVAVISRLSDQRPIGEGVEKRGHLETYRVRLRWIIRMAWELFKKPKPVNGQTPWYCEHSDFDQICALYRDEIVWLYNELGIISLVQGSLSDALGFLRQAYELNERIEGCSDEGAIAHHINLNHAIVQMERGRLPSARNRLHLVQEATKGRAWTLHHNAKGYLCVLDHITGRTDGLTERFCEVTDFFQKHNDSRAAAVFLNHRGRYLIAENRDEADRCITGARDMADTGGHEDLRHHIELSIIKLRLWRHQHLDDEAPRLAHSKNLRELSAIEAYARRMGIWSLQCDALRIRAEFLLLQGETTTAGRLLIRSMAICRRNAMRLRLNNALTIYAKVLHLRGDLNSARHMARLSLNLARTMNYNLETPRAQELLRLIDHEA